MTDAEKIAMLEKRIKEMEDFWRSTVSARVTSKARDAFEKNLWGALKICAVSETTGTGWIKVTPETMPENLQEVLALCKMDCSGTKYVCVAYYVGEKMTVEETGICWDSEVVEYDEERDEYLAPSGWFERIRNWDDYSSVGIEDVVTHWMPLPNPPKED